MDPREHKDRGVQLLAKGKLPATLAEFRAAVRADPRDFIARRKAAEGWRGWSWSRRQWPSTRPSPGRYASDGMLLEAIAVGKAILRLHPRHVETQRALAQFAIRRAQQPWQARLPPSMTTLKSGSACARSRSRRQRWRSGSRA
jgi:hypothetical protein